MVNRRQDSLLTKIIIVTIIALAALTVYRENFNGKLKLINEKSNKVDIVANFNEIIKKNGVLDTSGYYIIYATALQGTSSDTHGNDVSLVTHCSYENLAYLPQLAEKWQGPISIAIYTHDFINTFNFLQFLLRCHSTLRRFGTFHFVTDIHLVNKFNPGHKLNNVYILYEKFHDYALESCNNIEAIASKFTKNYNKFAHSYPINLIRNVALKNARTNYVLTVDIDILPSVNLHAQLRQFLEKEGSSTSLSAFILPVFEVNSSETTLNKQTIKELFKNGYAQPFYVNLSPHCHNRTDYGHWLKIDDTEELKSVYTVEWKHGYEPFFVARKSLLPSFDERFQSYGYNRVSQVCEMNVAGWEFTVCNPGFLIHQGFKYQIATFNSKKTADLKKNFRMYTEFIQGLSAKYPSSNRTCKI